MLGIINYALLGASFGLFSYACLTTPKCQEIAHRALTMVKDSFTTKQPALSIAEKIQQDRLRTTHGAEINKRLTQHFKNPPRDLAQNKKQMEKILTTTPQPEPIPLFTTAPAPLLNAEGEAVQQKGILYAKIEGQTKGYLVGTSIGEGNFGEVSILHDLEAGTMHAFKRFSTNDNTDSLKQTAQKVGEVWLNLQESSSSGKIMPLYLQGDRVENGWMLHQKHTLLSNEELRLNLPSLLERYIRLANHCLSLQKKGLYPSDIKPDNCVFSGDHEGHLIDLDNLWCPGREDKKLPHAAGYTLSSIWQQFVNAPNDTTCKEKLLHLSVFQMGMVFYELLGIRHVNAPFISQQPHIVENGLTNRLGQRHPLKEVIKDMLLKPTTTTLEEVVARLEGIKNHQTSWIPTFVKITFLASSVFLASLELFKWFRRAPA